MAKLTISCLGPLIIKVDGQEMRVNVRPRVWLLLTYLAIIADERRDRKWLENFLWSTYEFPAPQLARDLGYLQKKNVKQFKHKDKKVWLSGEISVDMIKFQNLVVDLQKRNQPPNEISISFLESLGEAVKLVNGSFLEGVEELPEPVFEGWRSSVEGKLRDQICWVFDQLIQAHLNRKPPAIAVAIGYAQRWIDIMPDHEPAHIGLMELYARNGDRVAARKQYSILKKALKEVGLKPSTKANKLYEEVESVQPSDWMPSVPIQDPLKEIDRLIDETSSSQIKRRTLVTVVTAEIVPKVELTDDHHNRNRIIQLRKSWINIIESYRGSIFDKAFEYFVATWGDKFAHENNPQRAVYAAGRMLEEGQSLIDEGVIHIRIGIDTDKILIDQNNDK